VIIYTDGACVPNPGPGGWGALLQMGGVQRELCGGDPTVTTNNRMELTAPIRALDSLPPASTVQLWTDSTYVRDGITKWMLKWKANGWQTAARQPVKNVDLWRELDAAVRRHTVQWHWVKGHAGHPGNEAADRLAARGMAEALAAPIPVVLPPAPAPVLSPAPVPPPSIDEPWATLF
jgi:ribonuclease HI